MEPEGDHKSRLVLSISAAALLLVIAASASEAGVTRIHDCIIGVPAPDSFINTW